MICSNLGMGPILVVSTSWIIRMGMIQHNQPKMIPKMVINWFSNDSKCVCVSMYIYIYTYMYICNIHIYAGMIPPANSSRSHETTSTSSTWYSNNPFRSSIQTARETSLELVSCLWNVRFNSLAGWGSTTTRGWRWDFGCWCFWGWKL